MQMQAVFEGLLRQPKKTTRDRNRRFLCECGNRVTKNQLRLHDGKCIYCGKLVRT
jgi:hypothetical protein